MLKSVSGQCEELMRSKKLGSEGITWGPFMLIEVGFEAEGLRMADDNDDRCKLRGIGFPGPEIWGSIYVG